MQIKDWRGVEIDIGAIVVYPVRGSTHNSMVEGVVVGVTIDDDRPSWAGNTVLRVMRRRENGHLVDGKVVTVGLHYVTVVGWRSLFEDLSTQEIVRAIPNVTRLWS